MFTQMNKRLILVSSKLHKDDREPLGHEIHLIRCAIINMITKNQLSPEEDTLITYRDRMFLYTNIFKKVLPLEDSLYLLFQSSNIVDFTFYPHHGINGLPVSKWECGDSTGYYNDNFIEICKKMEYKTDIVMKKEFVVIHHRYDAPLSILENIVDKLPFSLDRVIFFHDLSKISHIPATAKTNNLQEYATFLNSPLCRLVISEWSGAGQLAQYCSEAQILYYSNKYTLDVHLRPEEIVRQYIGNSYEDDYTQCMRVHEIWSKTKRICDSWDFKTITSCRRFYFPSIQTMLNSPIMLLI